MRRSEADRARRLGCATGPQVREQTRLADCGGGELVEESLAHEIAVVRALYSVGK